MQDVSLVAVVHAFKNLSRYREDLFLRVQSGVLICNWSNVGEIATLGIFENRTKLVVFGIEQFMDPHDVAVFQLGNYFAFLFEARYFLFWTIFKQANFERKILLNFVVLNQENLPEWAFA